MAAEIGIRYCGGCNPRYDRVAAVEALQETLPDIRVEPVRAGKAYDAVIAVCGCTARCATVDDLKVPPGRLFYASSPQDMKGEKDEWLEGSL